MMEADCLKLTTANNDLIRDNDALKKSNLDINNELNSLSAEIKILTTKYNDLEAKEKKGAKEIERLTVIEKSYHKLKMDYEILTNNSESMSNENTRLNILNKELEKSLKTKVAECENLSENLTKCKQDLINGELLRRKLHNNVQDLKGNIRVFCRVRPPINEEENNKLQCLLTFPDENTLEIRKSKESVSAVTGKPLDYKAEFLFDRVFQPESTQAEFFEELSQLVQSALDGYDVCVFAYGQTGSGKTYTMQGINTPEHLGMVPRSVDLIFKAIENLRRSNWIYTVKVSFLEIYNECVRDLLDPDVNRSSLEIKYNEGRGITVTNLKIENINSPEEFNALLEIAQQNRMVAATDFNEHSSRSHAIYKIYLYGSNEEYHCSCAGSVNLVDLAGSERAKTTSIGERLAETKNINTSLSILGHVMLALYNKEKHIPYRNSKLTYLLQSSLGGNSKTLMVVNISPFEEFYQESITSLRFATKVKEVKVMVKKNKAILTQATTSNGK
nr:protein claret segregational [Leptinotarsa decemlineata]